MAEKAILKYCNWKININSPSDFIDRIYNNLYIKYKNNNSVIETINKYKDITITLLEYAICEYNIFSEYNQIIVCLSSCFITIKQNIDEEKDECIDNNINNSINIQKELKDIVDNIVNKLNFENNLIDSCSSLILKYLERDDDNENNENDENKIIEKEEILDINDQLDITRSDSNISFCDIMNNYIFDSADNLNEKDNNLVNFGIISPIFNGENISLNEENGEKLFINVKQFNNDIKINDIIENEDLLLLKRKRKEKKEK